MEIDCDGELRLTYDLPDKPKAILQRRGASTFGGGIRTIPATFGLFEETEKFIDNARLTLLVVKNGLYQEPVVCRWAATFVHRPEWWADSSFSTYF